eukprot:XP_001706555.1 Hypothetical protein GL50803_37520 [Giardia lamblia ATCC 50803]
MDHGLFNGLEERIRFVIVEGHGQNTVFRLKHIRGCTVVENNDRFYWSPEYAHIFYKYTVGLNA